MKKNIGFGVFLLTLGLIWLLMNMGIMDWSVFESFFTLWPLIFVVIGINIIFKERPMVRLGVWLIFLAVIIGYGYYMDGRTSADEVLKEQNFVIEKLQETKNAKLKLGLGAQTLNVRAGGQNLIEGYISEKDIKKTEEYQNSKETAYIAFEEKNFRIGQLRKMNNSSSFNLNSDTVWDFDLDLGASKCTFDMTDLKVRDIDLDVGAGKLDLIFGDKWEEIDVDINAGASSINVIIPETTGLKLKMDGAISNLDYDDIKMEKSGEYYISENYHDAKTKIDIDVDMGLGNFDISTR